MPSSEGTQTKDPQSAQTTNPTPATAQDDAQTLLAQFLLAQGVAVADRASAAAKAPASVLPGQAALKVGSALALSDPLGSSGLSGAAEVLPSTQDAALSAQALLAQLLAQSARLPATAASAVPTPLHAGPKPQGLAPAGVKTPGPQSAGDGASAAHRGTGLQPATPVAAADPAPLLPAAAVTPGDPQVQWQKVQITQNEALTQATTQAAGRDAPSLPLSERIAGFVVDAALPGFVPSATTPADAASLRRRERTTPGADPLRFDAANLAAPVSAASPLVAGATSASAGSGVGSAVAEQVRYWIANGVQNAEMKLDGLGPDAVQVSISMSGQEAQVVFRSDQAQTRELLGSAMAQLEQSLRGEGLMLAGAWVGSSGQQAESGTSSQSGRGDQGRAAGQGLRVSAADEATPRRTPAANRALDLFV
jgi:flagellar hook-length control protein FliK